mmetsp:Transcript_12441/g.31846  ORF Transcript_12441/g.31846 Transcript_12441/m.31846 type:complete len:271 (+) Transcript_12441:812-1624(+)
MLRPQRHAEAVDLPARHALRRGGVARLVARHRQLRVSRACHRAHVDVGRAHDRDLVVHHHELGVHVDHEAPRTLERFVAGRHGEAALPGGAAGRRRGLRRRQVGVLHERVLRHQLALAEAVKVEVISGQGPEPVALDGCGNYFVHHVHGVLLPVEDGLHGLRSRIALWVERDDAVHRKGLPRVDLLRDFERNLQRDHVRGLLHAVTIPRVAAAQEVLVLDVDEALRAADVVNVRPVDAVLDEAAAFAPKHARVIGGGAHELHGPGVDGAE